VTDRRKIQEPPAYQEYERLRAWAHTLERFRLGEAIMDPSGFMAQDMAVAFKDQNFCDPLHRATFAAIRSLLARGARDLDVALVIGELQRLGTFAEFPNATSYVCSMTEGTVPPPSRESRLFRLHEMAWAWAELDRAKKEAGNG
jgi:DnaB helicase-like protein